jgi:hypothetical protein
MVKKNTKETITAKGTEIAVLSTGNEDDFISLTDIARYKNPEEPKVVVQNWMRIRSTIEFLGVWEQLNNPDFKGIEFDTFKKESGANAFTLSPQKWISTTNAIGIRSSSGRYTGGTFAHKDIAFEFATWISAEFKLYIIKEYQRLKEDENSRLSLVWNMRRTLAKSSYTIQTDAVKDYLISEDVPKQYQRYTYANEADILNVAVFGVTAKDWRENNPELDGNIRDHATLIQLIVLSTLEGLNAKLIRDSVDSDERLRQLRKEAAQQLRSLANSPTIKKLEERK